MTHVKICGVRTLADALAAANAGADMLGLNFYAASPRHLAPAQAVQLAGALRAELGRSAPLLAGLFVNHPFDDVLRIMAQADLDAAQLSGDEAPEFVYLLEGRGFKALRPRDAAEAVQQAHMYLPTAPEDPRLPTLLIDAHQQGAYGGTGQQTSLEIAQAVGELTGRWMLAGGLTPENVGGWVAQAQPWAVDVASGVESAPGTKDHGKIEAFIGAAKGRRSDGL